MMAIVAFTSCDTEVCKESMYTPMNVNFYYKAYPTQGFNLDTFSVFRVKDGVLTATEYIDTVGTSKLVLTLDPSSTVSKYYIKSEFFRDTIVVLHKNVNEFVSAECGARMVSHIDSFYFAAGHAEDSISISNPDVNGVYDAQNIKIYME